MFVRTLIFAGILFFPFFTQSAYVDSSLQTQANFCFPTGASASTHYNRSFVDQTTGTTTNFIVYDSTAAEANQNLCFHFRQYSATKQHTATTTKLIMVYEVVRNGGSCWMAWGTGTTTATAVDVTAIFSASSSSTATTTWTMNTADAGVWIGGFSRNGQSEDCTFKVRRLYNTEGVEYLTFLNTNTPTAGSTTTIPLYAPYVLDKLASMNCTYTASTTTCTPQYASSTVGVTPNNLLVFTVIFFIAFVSSYWVVRKLT